MLLPATCTVAVRGPPGFLATLNDAMPEPEPPDVIATIQGTELCTVQPHPPGPATSMSLRSPGPATSTRLALTVNWQGDGAWVSMIVWPFSETAPDRVVEPGFDAAVSVTVASPWPDAGETCSHGA